MRDYKSLKIIVHQLINMPPHPSLSPLGRGLRWGVKVFVVIQNPWFGTIINENLLSRKKARLKCRITKYQKGDVILNIGILGGSFDPPHFGHIFLCHYALESTEIKKVLIVPCFNHPFNKSLSTFEHRFNMCKLAFEIFGNSVEVTDIEKELGGISYSINTIKHLKNTRPDN